ncbi:hypothetical protein SAMN05660420_02441 [Desulfuromusa kysingii]|uniref:Uncharacterized protein n=1 Tax=Desulfuromusa kysingii TaxID=37625 RepID=A0A1H4C5F6_9BACT|nr:hypothetical protein [Desulfuromusa kysingii]SEA55604.1 hypothetical protein SAMN05660420_02441 [Desulfuromusa kysingii]
MHNVAKKLRSLLIFSIFVLLSCTSCGSSSSSSQSVRIIATASDQVEGATVTLYDSSGALLYQEINATDSSGSCSISIDDLPQAFVITVTDGTVDGVAFTDTLKLIVDDHDASPHSFYAINAATTLSAKLQEYQDFSFANAVDAVQSCFHLPEELSLETDLYFYSHLYDKADFYADAEDAGGLDLYIEQLAEEIYVASQSGSLATSCPTPLMAVSGEEGLAKFMASELAKSAGKQIGTQVAGWALKNILGMDDNEGVDEEISAGFTTLSNQLEQVNSALISLQTQIQDLHTELAALMTAVQVSEYDTIIDFMNEHIVHLKAANAMLYHLTQRDDLSSPQAKKDAQELYSTLTDLSLYEDLIEIQDYMATPNGAQNQLDALIDLYGKTFACDYDKLEKALAYFFHYETIALNLLLEKAHADDDTTLASQHLAFYLGTDEVSQNGMDTQTAMVRPYVEQIMLCSAYESEWLQTGGITPSPTVLRMQNMFSSLQNKSGLQFEVWIRKRALHYNPGGDAIFFQNAATNQSYLETEECWGMGSTICGTSLSAADYTLEPLAPTGQIILCNPTVAGYFESTQHILTTSTPDLTPGTYKILDTHNLYKGAEDIPEPIGYCQSGTTFYYYVYYSDRFLDYEFTIPEGDVITNLMITPYQQRYDK